MSTLSVAPQNANVAFTVFQTLHGLLAYRPLLWPIAHKHSVSHSLVHSWIQLDADSVKSTSRLREKGWPYFVIGNDIQKK